MQESTPDIVTIPDSEFDNWYNSTPAGTAAADHLIGAQQAGADEKPKPETGNEPGKQVEPLAPEIKQQGGIQVMDDKDFEGKENNAAIPADDKGNKDAQQPEIPNAPPAEHKELFRHMADYLVSSGKWADFDGREQMELDDDTYAQLVEKQDEYRLNQKWETKVAALGPYGKAILEYEANGGNASELIDQFKAQKEAQQYNIDSREGQIQFIRNYYQQELGWRKERVDKQILLLEMGGDEDLSAHAADLKADYDTLYNNRIEQMRASQETFKQEQQRKETEYANAISQAISKRDDLSEEEKKYYVDFALKYNTKLPDGRMVNQAYVKLAQIQSNPDLYARFLEFINDPEKYSQKISTLEQTKATKKAFQFVVGGKQKQAAGHIDVNKPPQFSFKGFF